MHDVHNHTPWYAFKMAMIEGILMVEVDLMMDVVLIMEVDLMLICGDKQHYFIVITSI